MKNILLAACAALTLATACKKDAPAPTPTPTVTQVTGDFRGSDEIPAVTTSASGTVLAS